MKNRSNSLETLIRAETDNTSRETKIYFDNLHLSPLKVNILIGINKIKNVTVEQIYGKFSMHDSEAK